MKSITILEALDVVEWVRENNPCAVLSIEHPGARRVSEGAAPRLIEEGIEGVDQRIQVYWDTEEDHPKGPSLRMVKAGLRFLLKHEKRSKRPLVVHCRQGKSRSVAMALAYLVAANRDKSIMECIAHLKTLRPEPAPNIKIIELADTALGLGNELVEAVKADAQFTANRAAANASRARWAEKNPESLKLPKLTPQKRGPKPKTP
ncbi:MAG: dual specificity protein phosphatase family protein [Alphaproteobacteria bacterium]|nr:dual specificity protein phosphatase family protein [Alphaproteobacteria bacterium]